MTMFDEEYTKALKKVLDLCEQESYYIVLSDLLDLCDVYNRDAFINALLKIARECK